MPEISLAGLDALLAVRAARGPQARGRHFAFQPSPTAWRLDIMGDIDPYFGVSAVEVLAQLDAVPADAVEIRIRINSYGGDVFEGVAIHNALAAHPARKVVEIIGCAASSASWVAMAADEVLIWHGAMMMIHQSWQQVIGNATLIDEAAKVLREIDSSMAAAYSRRTGLPDAEIRAMMAAETWMSAEEAVAKGFAHCVLAIGDAPAVPAAAMSVSRPATAISPEILAGLRALADAMGPNGGKNV